MIPAYRACPVAQSEVRSDGSGSSSHHGTPNTYGWSRLRPGSAAAVLAAFGRTVAGARDGEGARRPGDRDGDAARRGGMGRAERATARRAGKNEQTHAEMGDTRHRRHTAV